MYPRQNRGFPGDYLKHFTVEILRRPAVYTSAAHATLFSVAAASPKWQNGLAAGKIRRVNSRQPDGALRDGKRPPPDAEKNRTATAVSTGCPVSGLKGAPMPYLTIVLVFAALVGIFLLLRKLGLPGSAGCG